MELEVGVRWRSSGRVNSLPSVNFESRLGRVLIRRLGGEEGEGFVEGVGCAIFEVADLVEHVVSDVCYLLRTALW
jgi:hypothetical protein